MKRILVTGAEGFVGRHLMPALSADAEVVRASRSPVAGARDEIYLDLLDEVSVASAVAAVSPDTVIHLAAQSSVAGSVDATALTWAVNRDGSARLAHAVATAAPTATVLFVSSAEVYGSSFNDGIATEASPTAPLSPYAQSKVAAEQAFREILPETSRLIIARPGNHSGAGQSTTFVIPSLAYQVAAVELGRQPTVLVGGLESRRDFLDVADVVAAYLTLLAAAPSLPPASIVNIASGTTTRIADIAAALVAMAHDTIEVVVDPARVRPSEVPNARIAAEQMRAFGWAPTVPLQATLAAVLDAERRRCLAEPA